MTPFICRMKNGQREAWLLIYNTRPKFSGLKLVSKVKHIGYI